MEWKCGGEGGEDRGTYTAERVRQGRTRKAWPAAVAQDEERDEARCGCRSRRIGRARGRELHRTSSSGAVAVHSRPTCVPLQPHAQQDGVAPARQQTDGHVVTVESTLDARRSEEGSIKSLTSSSSSEQRPDAAQRPRDLPKRAARTTSRADDSLERASLHCDESSVAVAIVVADHPPTGAQHRPTSD